MKILNTDDDVLKVYYTEYSTGKELIILEFDNAVNCHHLTPIEAQQLADHLNKLCKQTKYFQGFHKTNEGIS